MLDNKLDRVPQNVFQTQETVEPIREDYNWDQLLAGLLLEKDEGQDHFVPFHASPEAGSPCGMFVGKLPGFPPKTVAQAGHKKNACHKS